MSGSGGLASARRRGAFLAALAVLAAAAGAYLAYRPGPRVPPAVEAAGSVEGRETVVASKIGGRLRSVWVREGDSVRAGQLLAELESDELEAAAEQAEAALAVAQATLSSGREAVMNAEAQLRAAGAEVESARAGVARAEARLTQAEKDLARDAELYKGGILPRATAEAAQTERDTRRADLEVARAALAAAQSRSEAARTAVGQARANLAALEARVVEAGDGAKLARARLADARILSPVAAAVAYRGAEPGEVVSAGAAILTLVDTANLWVRLDLGQADAARVGPGMPATVAVDGLTGRAFGGQVWDVAREGEFATQRDVTRGRQDIRTFRVRVRVADPTGTLRPGMTVRASIPLGSAPR